ncbi:MAG: hypothetical protein JXB45_11510 [Candidatus Krumholzibacteriota bacterium]|nr:hypothetical protein [Candidatus Krumholzibacteriota bacterium]
MLLRKISSLYRLGFTVLFILGLTLLFSCEEQPTAISDGSPGSGNYDSGEIDPNASEPFLLGSVVDPNFAAGSIEVWGMNVSFDSELGIVSFEVRLLNRTDRTIPPPIHFTVIDIIPDNIALMGFDGVSGDGFPFFDFSTKLGDDNVLEPQEWTESVTLQFHTVTPRSFAIGFRIDLGPPPGSGIISGVVFRDDNHNGIRERCERREPGIPGITVALEKPLESGEMVVLLTKTDRNGAYSFWGLKAGVYKVFLSPGLEGWEFTTPHPLLITLVQGPDGKVQAFYEAHFGLFPLNPPPPDNIFGPVTVGPFMPVGTLLDSTFIVEPSILTVVFHYYLDVMEPPFLFPQLGVVDSAAAWINDEMVFSYHREDMVDSLCFPYQTVRLPEELIKIGENSIRLFTDGNEYAALMWRVYRKP